MTYDDPWTPSAHDDDASFSSWNDNGLDDGAWSTSADVWDAAAVWDVKKKDPDP